MNALNTLSRPLRRLSRALGRAAMAVVSNPAFAHHTPAGPGSLATGQAGIAGRSGAPIRPDASPRNPGSRPGQLEPSLPLRQAF